MNSGIVNANLAYLQIQSFEEPVVLWWHLALWKSNLPGKIKYFCCFLSTVRSLLGTPYKLEVFMGQVRASFVTC